MIEAFFRHSIVLCFLTFICKLVFANSGIYENLLIGIDPHTGTVTGAFHEERNPPIGPSFSCIFSFKGNIKESSINIGFPGDKKLTQGEIKFEEGKKKKSVFLKLAEQQPGCLQTTSFDFLQGDILELTTTKPWIAVMVVIAKKTHFYVSPDYKRKRRGYLVYADCVGILEIKDDWVKIEYVAEDHSQVGWLRLQDLGGL